jgi:hypothetical protein
MSEFCLKPVETPDLTFGSRLCARLRSERQIRSANVAWFTHSMERSRERSECLSHHMKASHASREQSCGYAARRSIIAAFFPASKGSHAKTGCDEPNMPVE